MLILKLLRYIQGYVVFKAFGGFPERFINLCTRNKIPLWNIENKGGTINAYTTAYALEYMRKTAEKSGMEIDVVRISSLKKTFEEHRGRKGLLIALFICFAVTVFLSFFIWSISVDGNEKYTKEEIISVFEEQGVKIGALKSKIDTRQVSENAVIQLPDLSWAKVNIRGCFAIIEVRESIKKPVLLNENTPVNIVASEDGQIMKYEVSKGQPILKSGIAVTKGELLVSGVLANSDGSERLVHSKAFITARVVHKVKGGFKKSLYSLSDETINKSVFFFGISLPRHKNENEFESKQYLNSNKKILPVGFFRYRKAEYENEYELNPDCLLLLNAFCFNKEASKINENAENVIKAKIKYNGENITGEFVCEDKISEEKEILVG